MAAEHVRHFNGFTPTEHHDTYPFVDPLQVDLSGKSVFITGASKGIGYSISVSYARAGASSIAVAARSSLTTVASDLKAAAKAAGRSEPQVVQLKMDVTSKDSVAACAEQVRSQIGEKLDIIIANHGAGEVFTPITESDTDTWWHTYEVNIKGSYLVARAFLPFVQRKDSLGIFVAVGSIGQHMLTDGASSYQSGKLALHRICEFICTEGEAAEKAGKIEKAPLAFVIHPGGVLTDMALTAMPKHLHQYLTDKPELAGDTLVWLTKESRDWLKGRYIAVDWDMQELEGMWKEIVEKDLLKMKLTCY